MSVVDVRTATSVPIGKIGEVNRVASRVAEPNIVGLANRLDAAQLCSSAGRCFPP